MNATSFLQIDDGRAPYYSTKILGASINIFTGACIKGFDDLRIPGKLNIDWFRFYNSSHSTEDRGLGLGFRHLFDRSIVHVDQGLMYTDHRGEQILFPFPNNDGDRVTKQGVLLEKVSEGQYRVVRLGYPTAEFQQKDPSEPAKLRRLISNEGWARVNYSPDGWIQSINTSDKPDKQRLVIKWDHDHIVGLQLVVDGVENSKFFARYSYSEEGLLISATGSGQRHFRYQYGAENRLEQSVEPGEFSSLFEYDKWGRCCCLKGRDGFGEVHIDYYPDAEQTLVTCADGGRWLYTFSDGQIKHVLDPHKQTTSFEYDENGLITKETDRNGRFWQYKYDGTGTPISKEAEGHKISLSKGERSEPSLHRVPDTALEWSYGNLFPPPDRLPDVYALPSDIPTPVLRLIKIGEGVGPKTGKVEKDELRRPYREYFENMLQFRSCGYDIQDNILWYEDRDERRIEYEYTPQNLLASVKDSTGVVVSIGRTNDGKINSISGPSGEKSIYHYDQLGRLTEVHRQGKLRERYVYDAVGNVTEKQVQGESREVSLLTSSYNAANLKTFCSLASGDQISFAYDEQHRLIGGKNNAGSVQFGYKLSTEQRIKDLRDGLGIKHQYGPSGLTGTRILEKFSVKYEQKDYTTRIITDPTGCSHKICQIYAGIMCRVNSNGTREISQFDSEGRCLVQAVQDISYPEQAWIRLYFYSEEGILTSIHDSERGDTRYIRDKRNMLSEVHLDDHSIEKYEYNQAGNLLACPDKTLSYDSAGKLISVNGEAIDFDDRLNIRLWNIDRKMRWFQYDSSDQLEAVRFPDGKKTEFEYDLLGRRTKKTFDGKQWTYYWDSDRLMAEIMPDGAVRTYIYADEFSMVPFLFVDFESIHSDPADGRRYFLYTNHIGFPILVMDDERQAVWEAIVDPYGTVQIIKGEDFYQPLRFPGHFFDSETGLFYNRFRYYSPLIRAYLQPNPFGLSGGTNLYEYVKDPLSQVNVLGLISSGSSGKSGLSSTVQPFVRPDTEGVEPLVPWPDFAIGRGTLGIEASLSKAQNGAFTAIQTCRQLLNRSRDLQDRYESKLQALEKRWTLTLNTSENPSMTQTVIGDFLNLESDASDLEGELRNQISEEDDLPTHEITHQRETQLQFMQGIQQRMFTSPTQDEDDTIS